MQQKICSLATAAFLLAGIGTQAALSQKKEPPMGVNLPQRVVEGVSRPEKISGVYPVYPEIARKARIQGVVIVEAIIDEKGNVTDTHILKGLPLGLDQAAVDAVKTWKFKPARFEGRAVKVYYTLTVNFKAEILPTYGPQFRKLLQENSDFAAALEAQRYRDAAQILDRWVNERPAAAEIALARCYLLLEQGRLKEAWEIAQSSGGSDPFELPYAVGLVAWRKVSQDKLLSPEARSEALEVGIQAETRAMALRQDALAPVIYMVDLLRQKAKLTSDPQEREALNAESVRLANLARELRSKGAIPDPFASETN